MFQSMTDVLRQSQFRSQNVYIIPFANMLPYKLKRILAKISSQDILAELEQEFVYWEILAIYHQDFTSYLISQINECRVCLYSGTAFIVEDLPEPIDEVSLKESIHDIMHNPLMREVFTLNVMEDNVYKFNMNHISAENLEKFLNSNPCMTEQIANAVDISEQLCLNYRRFVVDDLIRREKLLIALSQELENERKEYIIKANKDTN